MLGIGIVMGGIIMDIDKAIAKGMMPDLYQMDEDVLREYLFRWMYLTLGFYAVEDNYSGVMLEDKGEQAREAMDLVKRFKMVPE